MPLKSKAQQKLMCAVAHGAKLSNPPKISKAKAMEMCKSGVKKKK
jgi:hypothetical protein